MSTVEVAHLKYRIDSLEAKQADKDLKQMSKSATGAEKSFFGLSKGVALVGSALTAIGLGQGIVSVARNTREFGKAVSELSAITGATGQDLEYLKTQAKEIGSTTTLSASQAAEAFKLIASAKPDLLESGEALNAVTREAVTLAEAANIDLAQAADSLGTSLNQFGAGAEEASRFINVLAAGSQLGASSIADTSLALKNAGAAANAAGVDFETTNAAIQALAAGGIKAGEAGTGLRNVILKLEESTEKGLRPSVVGLDVAISNLATKQLDITEMTEIFGRQNVVAAQTLVDNADAVSRLTTALEGTDTAYRQAAINTDNLDGDIKSLASAYEGLTLTLGEEAEPAMRDVVQATTDMVRVVDDWLASGGLERLGMEWDASTDMMRAATEIWVNDTGSGINAIHGAMNTFLTDAEEDNLGVVQNLVLTWSQGMVSIQDLVKTAAVNVGATFDRMMLEANRFRARDAEFTFKVLSGLGLAQSDWAKAQRQIYEELNQTSLEYAQDIDRINQAQNQALQDIQNQTNASFQGLESLADKLRDGREAFEGWTRTVDEAGDEATETALQGIDAVSNSLLILRPELIEANEQTTDLVQEWGLLNPVLKEGEFRMKGVQEFTGKTNAEMQIHKNMVENVQREWANLIDTLIDGESDIGDFFDTIAKGIKRAFSEAAAADLTSLIFGGGSGGNISALLGGLPLPGGSGGGLGGSLTGLLGIGGGAASGGLLSGIGGLFGGSSAAAAPGSFASLASSYGVKTGLSGALGNLGAFATSPVGLLLGAGLLGTAIHNKTNDPDGFHRAMGGFLGAPTPGAPAGSTFQVSPFASGFRPTGFADGPTSVAAASSVIDQFRFVDQTITDLVRELGGNVDMSRATLGGFGLDGSGAGTFFGRSQRTSDAEFQNQIDSFARQLALHVNGLDEDTMREITGGSATLQDIVDALQENTAALTTGDGTGTGTGSTGRIVIPPPAEPPPPKPSLSTNLGSAFSGGGFALDTDVSDAAIDLYGSRGEVISFAEKARRERVADNVLMTEYGYNFGSGKWDTDASAMRYYKARSDIRNGLIPPPPIKGATNPIFAREGLAHVPLDNMPALLHQGERVLTKDQASEFNSAGGGGLDPSFKAAMRDFVNIIKDWERRGLPQERS